MKRRRSHSPIVRRRIGLGLIAAAALLAGSAAVVRARSDEGRGSYLLDVIAIVIAAAGAVMESRAELPLLDAGMRSARRRATLFTLTGLGAAIGGCVLATAAIRANASAIAQAFSYAGLFAGFGLGLAGACSLLWHYGGSWAADRLEQTRNDDWK